MDIAVLRHPTVVLVVIPLSAPVATLLHLLQLAVPPLSQLPLARLLSLDRLLPLARLLLPHLLQ
jgi:hypothetical protein